MTARPQSPSPTFSCTPIRPVRCGELAVPLKLKRGLALIAYLAEAGRKVARLQAASLPWPLADETVGRGRLRRRAIRATCDRALQRVAEHGAPVGQTPRVR